MVGVGLLVLANYITLHKRIYIGAYKHTHVQLYRLLVEDGVDEDT